MKKIDYYDLYDKPEAKPKLTPNGTFALNLVDSIENNYNENKRPRTKAEQLRINELKAIKQELYLLRTSEKKVKISADTIRDRRKELIHGNKMLQKDRF